MIEEVYRKTPDILQDPLLFLPESFIPKQSTLIDESSTGALFEVGHNEIGDLYLLKPHDQSSKEVILFNRNSRRIKLKESPPQVDTSKISEELQRLSEHIYFPERISPIHRMSQEMIMNHWGLVSPLLESEMGKKVVKPECYLEVALQNGTDNSTEGIADAIGITSKGNFIIMEHNQFGGKSTPAHKYRQVEGHAKSFLEKFGSSLSVRPVCLFFANIDPKTFFIKVGHANQSV